MDMQDNKDEIKTKTADSQEEIKKVDDSSKESPYKAEQKDTG